MSPAGRWGNEFTYASTIKILTYPENPDEKQMRSQNHHLFLQLVMTSKVHLKVELPTAWLIRLNIPLGSGFLTACIH
jgi:hypothetical protein